MNCNLVQEQLSAYLDQMLTHEETNTIRKHLTSCSACRIEWEMLQITVEAFSAMEEVEPPVDFWNKLSDRLTSESMHISKYSDDSIAAVTSAPTKLKRWIGVKPVHWFGAAAVLALIILSPVISQYLQQLNQPMEEEIIGQSGLKTENLANSILMKKSLAIDEPNDNVMPKDKLAADNSESNANVKEQSIQLNRNNIAAGKQTENSAAKEPLIDADKQLTFSSQEMLNDNRTMAAFDNPSVRDHDTGLEHNKDSIIPEKQMPRMASNPEMSMMAFSEEEDTLLDNLPISDISLEIKNANRDKTITRIVDLIKKANGTILQNIQQSELGNRLKYEIHARLPQRELSQTLVEIEKSGILLSKHYGESSSQKQLALLETAIKALESQETQLLQRINLEQNISLTALDKELAAVRADLERYKAETIELKDTPSTHLLIVKIFGE